MSYKRNETLIYVRLRLVLANDIDTYLRLNMSVAAEGICNLEFVVPNLSLIYFCLSEIYKTFCCEFPKGYFVVRKMEVNDSIEAF